MNIAVILAGGIGKRMNNKYDMPKQFIKLKGKEIIIHTVQQFEKCSDIHKILIVMNPFWIEFTKKLIKKHKLSKVVNVISGGKTRQESSYKSLCYLKEKYYSNSIENTKDIILIHDAVRPFVTKEVINNIISKSIEYGAVCCVVKTIDTIVEAENSFVKSIPKRDRLYREQTPQGFNFSLIWNAYKEGKNKYLQSSTDDISFIHNIGKPVYLIEGDYHNFKITTSQDILIAEYLLTKETNKN